jgi:mannitol/fructose-specific phosphotransferase system IIA component (Ntr-type)
MFVKMLNGNVEEVFKFVGEDLIRRGVATEIKNDEAILKAEDNGGAAATFGIEIAVAVPKTESAVMRFVRTLRSR